ncbi:hypothetical protein JTB14_015786 [Gonioctena quinquepunctata]|nr:hypothetical protein JTB14_015786 [Gonioctena quinquepunctata]
MHRRFYGLGLGDIKRLAYQLAIRNGLRHPFSHESGAAGKKWLKEFLKRNQNLSIRKPQEMQKINHNPARVSNVDESGITTVQSKTIRVITLKRERQVGAVTAAERGLLVTVVFCKNAAGGFVPPLFFFSRNKHES